jgi:hypothetical protein
LLDLGVGLVTDRPDLGSVVRWPPRLVVRQG